jgi:hypothetical protein
VKAKQKNSIKALVYRYIAEQLADQALHYFRESHKLETNKAVTKKGGKIYVDIKKIATPEKPKRKRGGKLKTKPTKEKQND